MILDAAQLEQRYAQRIAGVAGKSVFIGPEVLALDINNSCNLSCQYCWTHAPGNPAHFEKARHFPWEKFLNCINDAVELSVDQIHLVGSGEPTIHPQFREMMRYLEDKPLLTRVFTNATFPLEYCEDVIRGDQVIVDLSAVNRQQYQELQGKDLFDRVVANIKRLVALRDAQKPGFHIEIVYIVNAMNVDQKEQMQELADELGVNALRFGKMNAHDYNRGIALSDSSIADLEGEQKRTPPACLNGWFYMIVKAEDNKASSCCRIPNMRLGELDHWSLKKLWASTKMMNMRLLGKYGEIQKMYKACQTCPYYEKNIERAHDAAQVKANEKALT